MFHWLTHHYDAMHTRPEYVYECTLIRLLGSVVNCAQTARRLVSAQRYGAGGRAAKPPRTRGVAPASFRRDTRRGRRRCPSASDGHTWVADKRRIENGSDLYHRVEKIIESFALIHVTIFQIDIEFATMHDSSVPTYTVVLVLL